MTLKQFFQLAGGIVVALIINALPLLAIIRWPLSILSVILGIGLAFLPFEERPLEKWIFAFFKSIYSPTIFYWQKSAAPAQYFQAEDVNAQITTTPAQEEALKNYLASQPITSTATNSLEQAEKGFLSKLTGMLTVVQTNPATPQAPAVEPKPTVLEVPQVEPTKITPAQPPKLVVQERPSEVFNSATVTAHAVPAPIVAGNEMVSTNEAIFSVDAAPPNPPTTPNVVVGQVVDQDRKIIEGAIMEIRDEMSRPIRALRSNRAGHFVIVTQLDNGKYDILTEKDGYTFTPVFFEANGNLIPPILIKGVKNAEGATPQ